MGKSTHCVASSGMKKGPWTPAEDQKLSAFVQKHGHGNWQSLPQKAGNLVMQKQGSPFRTDYNKLADSPFVIRHGT
ncbi:hypothetical protein ACE6H2_010291 [Prunus campanulata]